MDCNLPKSGTFSSGQQSTWHALSSIKNSALLYSFIYVIKSQHICMMLNAFFFSTAFMLPPQCKRCVKGYLASSCSYVPTLLPAKLSHAEFLNLLDLLHTVIRTETPSNSILLPKQQRAACSSKLLRHILMHWNRLPKEAVDAPSLQAFKARLNVALGSLGCWLTPLHIAGGWN